MPADARRAVFFDRDGTLMEDAHYCGDPALVKVFPGVPEALRRLKEAGFGVFIITNQSGIGRGLITEAQYRAVHEEFLRQAGSGWIDASYYCPDAPGVAVGIAASPSPAWCWPRPRSTTSTWRRPISWATSPPTSNAGGGQGRAPCWC